MRIPDHFVRVIALPSAVRGVTVPNDDGTFSVYINAVLDADVQRKALEHELAHLARDHFYKAAPIARQEAEAAGNGPPAPAAPERRIRRYAGLTALEGYLRSIDALDVPIERLGQPMH
ncbi:MAG: hypothetical protein IKQ10_05675 [Oscillospiraceae bacterium]|nr:hypothetical protein [Oscillospiraceae bacterium]